MRKRFVLLAALTLAGVFASIDSKLVEGKAVTQVSSNLETRAVADAAIAFLKTMHVHTIHRDPTNDYGVRITDIP